ncbi:hypothetical protein EDB89DRAFT_479039 [Lactarius sanguifluus]|nr:hypothetical protein EDB89DRAFT_479039 [Lactarius sanguifluus]
MGPSCPSRKFRALFDILPCGVNTVLDYRTISDESRGGIPYSHTKTVWEKPDGFVIPLTVLHNTALGRRLSKSFSSTTDQSPPPHAARQQPRPLVDHPRSYKKEQFKPLAVYSPLRVARLPLWRNARTSRPAYPSQPSFNFTNIIENQQAFTSDPHFSTPSRLAPAPPPIPGSEASTPPTPTHWHRSEVITGRSVQPINVRRSLDTVFRLQKRTYPTQRVPIVLPLLIDGVLALGGGVRVYLSRTR